jgi:hypothetical protein
MTDAQRDALDVHERLACYLAVRELLLAGSAEPYTSLLAEAFAAMNEARATSGLPPLEGPP